MFASELRVRPKPCRARKKSAALRGGLQAAYLAVTLRTGWFIKCHAIMYTRGVGMVAYDCTYAGSNALARQYRYETY